MKSTPPSTITYSVSDSVAWREVDGEVFAVTSDGVMHNIRNPVGLFIFKALLQDGATVSSIASQVVDAFEVSPDTAREDATEFIEHLVAKGVVKKRG
mgnify:CR=1 FL=1